MKLPISSFFEKKEKQEFFLAVLLRDDLIKVIIFEQIENKIKVITHHTEHFTTTLEEASIEEWTDTFDKAVGTAENTLPENAELKKTVFGVKQNWVADTKIKKEYLQKLKKVSEELDLQPIGFLVFSEAIIHLLQKEQGIPVSGILVELGKRNVIVTIIRAGKIVETKELPLGETPVQTVEAALKHVTNVEILPSKIILFDGDTDDTLTQEFISYPWNDNLPFLHVPQVDLLSPDFDAKAVMYGTSIQLGLELIEETLHSEKVQEPTVPEEKEELPEVSEKTVKTTHSTIKQTILNADSFGFVTDKDIAAVTKPEEISVSPLIEQTNIPVSTTPLPEEEPVQKPFLTGFSLKNIFRFPSFKKNQEPSTAFNSPTNQSRWKLKKILFIMPLLLLILVGGIILYITEVRATVTLQVIPKILEKNQSATFSTKESNNFGEDILSVSETTVSEDGTVSTDATGKKDTGTPAKGTVTVFNSSESTKKIASGSTLTAANGLKFTVDKDTTVASASGDIFSGTKPGTTDITITASQIGEDYNFPSGTKFSFNNDSSMAAKNTSAFSGGTKKQITAVAKADLDKLQSDLQKNLESKAKDDVGKNAGTDKGVVPVILSESTTKKQTDKNIGDEAKTITMQGTVTYTGMTYDKKELDTFAKFLFKKELTGTTSLSSQGITDAIDTAAGKDDHTATGIIKVRAAIMPSIDTKKIVSDIKGKPSSQAKTILAGLSQIGSSTITFSPNIPFLPKLVPMFENHIKIIIQSK